MRRRIGLSLLVIFILLLPRTPVRSHGLGKQQLERAVAGPFRVSAWTDPVDVQSDDELHVTVAVEDDEGLVLHAGVQITATYDNQSESARATHDQAVNKLQYEARLNLQTAGEWRILITIQDGERRGDAQFGLNVSAAEEEGLPYPLIIGGSIGAVMALLGYRNYRNFKKKMQAKGRL